MRFDHGGASFAVFRAKDDSVWCTAGFYTHEDNHLADGLVMDFEIECPKHASVFDIRTGEVLTPPACENLKTFSARVENGVVEISF